MMNAEKGGLDMGDDNKSTPDKKMMLDVAEIYQDTQDSITGEYSLKETARLTGLSRNKVRKILVTLGLIESSLPQKVYDLLAKGEPLKTISKETGISVSTISNHIPYQTVLHDGEQFSPGKLKERAYRERIKKAKAEQEPVAEKEWKDNLATSFATSSFLFQNSMGYRRLHLELINDCGNQDILKKYGNASRTGTVCRDIIIPGDITLHALHYVIQRAFGFQNRGNHYFTFSDERLDELLLSGLSDWYKLCGILFPRPSFKETAVRWDDDYEDGSFNNWLKSKYKRPYDKLCYEESFVLNFMGAWRYAEQHIHKKIKIEEKEYYFSELRPDQLKYLYKSKRMRILEKSGIKLLASKGEKIHRTGIDVFNEAVDVRDIEFYINHDFPKYQPQASCVAHEIFYEYGKWNIKITAYLDCKDPVEHKFVTEQEVFDCIKRCIETNEPQCLAVDGYKIIDDIGGIEGYIKFLEQLHAEDEETRRAASENAKAEGWKKWKMAPKNIL